MYYGKSCKQKSTFEDDPPVTLTSGQMNSKVWLIHDDLDSRRCKCCKTCDCRMFHKDRIPHRTRTNVLPYPSPPDLSTTQALPDAPSSAYLAAQSNGKCRGEFANDPLACRIHEKNACEAAYWRTHRAYIALLRVYQKCPYFYRCHNDRLRCAYLLAYRSMVGDALLRDVATRKHWWTTLGTWCSSGVVRRGLGIECFQCCYR